MKSGSIVERLLQKIRPSPARTTRRRIPLPTQAELWAALDRLSQEDRGILILKDVEGLSYAAIARCLGINEGSVAQRLFRARQALLGPWSALRARSELLEYWKSAPEWFESVAYRRGTEMEEQEDGPSPEAGPARVAAIGLKSGYPHVE